MLEKFKHAFYLYVIIWLRYFTLKKMYNFFLNLYERKIKREQLRSVPFIVNIDVSNVCILGCPLCPTGRKDSSQTKGTMTLAQFKIIFDKIKDYVFDVKLYNWGEPFLCHDLFLIVEYCHANKVGVRLHSNLNYYTEEILQNIVKYKIDYLHLSIDGFTQENYQFYRRNGDIAKVFAGLKKIQELKKEQGSFFPIIHWGYLINNKNKAEVLLSRDYAKKLKVEIFEAFNMCLFTTLGDKYNQGHYQEFLSEVVAEEKCNFRTDKNHCPYLWNELSINPNGTFYPCCIMYEDKDVFGQFNDDRTIQQIVNSEIFIESRNLFRQKDYKSKIATPCQRCTWYKKY
ncbi:MAG: radical SAM protein [Patescibacteria group bacterium]